VTATPSPQVPVSLLRDLVRTGRFQEALDLHRRLATGAPGRRADVQLLAATAATRLGELGAAETLASEALSQFHARGDRDGSMRALNLLGAIQFERGQLELAEHFFGEALRLARQLEDSLLFARACNNLASVANLRGRSGEAASLYRAALLAYQRLGDRRGTAETYHNLGLVYRESREWRHAEQAAAQAVRHAELAGERGLLALAVTGRAEVSAGENQLAVAESELERAERLAAEAGDEIGGAEVRRVRALVALRRNDFEGALENAEHARKVALVHESALLAAECATVAALALRALGRTAEAEERRQESQARLRALGARTLLERFERDWNH